MNFYGGNAETNADWFHSAACQAQYKKYIRAVVSRYTNSSAIFAWELANEPRCKGCSTDVITQWASSTAKYIKSLDPLHMVTMGDEGFGLKVTGDTRYPWSFAEGTDFARNLAIKELDFGTFHFYPQSCKCPSPPTSWPDESIWRRVRLILFHAGSVPNDLGNLWVQKHAEACVQARKRCVFEEYGVATRDKCAPVRSWQRTSKATTGMASDMFWQYGDTLSAGKTADDGNTIYKGSDVWKCAVEDHVKEIL
jgi:mannan endo-1,4-beta-mannosidase